MRLMRPPITHKLQMYAMLGRGEFGNFNQQWFDLTTWLESPERVKYPLWGVRSLTGGGDARMRLNCPAEEVQSYVRDNFEGETGFQLSPMLDEWVILKGEVIENPEGEPGLFLRYVPPGMVDANSPWRGSFQKYGRHVQGSAAIAILKAYLWPDDYEHMRQLLDDYPGHAVEFSACSRAVGVIPGFNTVVWEVRHY